MPMVGEKVRQEKPLDSSGSMLRPQTWFPPPDANRSRLFLGNEKHSFLGISLRARW